MPAKYPCEMYGQLFYGPELTYSDLYEHEHRLVDEVTAFLSANGAVHLDFTPDGDSLRFQCELDAYAMLTEDIEGRLLFVDKAALSVVHVYALAHDKWQEAAIGIPRSAFFAAQE